MSSASASEAHDFNRRRAGVSSIGGSIERQVDALVCHDAMGADEARLDVLRLELWIALQDRLRPISCGEHSENMFDGKSVAPNRWLAAKDIGVHGDPLKEFIGCRHLPLHRVLSPPRPPTVSLDPLCTRRKRGGQGQFEDRNCLTIPAAATDGDDLLGCCQVDSIDEHADTEHRRLEWQLETVLEHRQELYALLGLSVCIDGCGGDEAVQPGRGES